MKTLPLICLILLLAEGAALGVTNCQIEESAESSVVTCVGDEKNPAEPAAPQHAVRPAPAPTAETPKTETSVRTAAPEPAAAAAAPARPASGPTASAPLNAAAPKDKVASHLTKRRELAERATRTLKPTPSAP